jgi:hypothetical protein
MGYARISSKNKSINQTLRALDQFLSAVKSNVFLDCLRNLLYPVLDFRLRQVTPRHQPSEGCFLSRSPLAVLGCLLFQLHPARFDGIVVRQVAWLK